MTRYTAEVGQQAALNNLGQLYEQQAYKRDMIGMQVNQGVERPKYHSLTVARIVHGGYAVSGFLSPADYTQQLFAATTLEEAVEWIKKNIA